MSCRARQRAGCPWAREHCRCMERLGTWRGAWIMRSSQHHTCVRCRCCCCLGQRCQSCTCNRQLALPCSPDDRPLTLPLGESPWLLSKTEGMQLVRDYAMRGLNDAPTLMLFLRSGRGGTGPTRRQPKASSTLCPASAPPDRSVTSRLHEILRDWQYQGDHLKST